MIKPEPLDVLGQLAYDVLNDQDPEDVVVHSDLCEPDLLPKEILFRNETLLFEVEEKALEHVEGKVLDVGSGTGCLLLLLQSKGFEVSGIDTSHGLVDYQQEMGLNARCIDFFELEEEHYDTLFFMMNGIGIVGMLRKMPEFFRKIDQLMTEGGKALVDSSDIAYMYENEDGSISINLNQDYYGEMKYQMQYKENFGEWFDWLYLDFETLSKLADENGFRAHKLFEDNNHRYLAEIKRK